MRPFTIRFLSCISVALLVGCSYRSTHVRLRGDPLSIASLGGVWDGRYWGAPSGRSGNLSFYLPTGTDSLAGDVMMLDAAGIQLVSADPAESHRMHVRSPKLLRVDIVIAAGDSVRRVLEPYIAPDCQCTAYTTFIGRVTGDEIDGTFETRSSSASLGAGLWHVTRTGTTLQ